MASEWIDISVAVTDGMVHWEGDPACYVSYFCTMEGGAPCNVSQVSMSCHTGTHMDGPRHFIKNGKGLETLPFEATVGPCRVIEIKNNVAVTVEDLQPHKLKRGERILLKTPNSKKSWKMAPSFHREFVYISQEAARYIAACGVRTIGIDYLSVGGFSKDGVETHHALLGGKNPVWIIEGLNLAKVAPGKYDLICLPVKFSDNADGAPARAILRRR